LLDLGEPVLLGVEPVEIAIEDDRRSLFVGQPLDLSECREVAVEPTDDIEHARGKFRRAIEDSRRVAVIGWACPAGAFGLIVIRADFYGVDAAEPSRTKELAHSAASFSAPPQLDPWPAVQP
jgi:hypothetical protein